MLDQQPDLVYPILVGLIVSQAELLSLKRYQFFPNEPHLNFLARAVLNLYIHKNVSKEERENYLIPDGHPNARGYRIITENILKVLAENDLLKIHWRFYL